MLLGSISICLCQIMHSTMRHTERERHKKGKCHVSYSCYAVIHNLHDWQNLCINSLYMSLNTILAVIILTTTRESNNNHFPSECLFYICQKHKKGIILMPLHSIGSGPQLSSVAPFNCHTKYLRMSKE